LACRMDRWRWLQHERAERPPNHRLPNAASSGRDESAQRASSFLANENNGKDQCWSATIHLNRFGLAAAAANIRTAASFCLMVGLDHGKSSIQAATWNGRTVVSSRP